MTSQYFIDNSSASGVVSDSSLAGGGVCAGQQFDRCYLLYSGLGASIRAQVSSISPRIRNDYIRENSSHNYILVSAWISRITRTSETSRAREDKRSLGCFNLYGTASTLQGCLHLVSPITHQGGRADPSMLSYKAVHSPQGGGGRGHRPRRIAAHKNNTLSPRYPRDCLSYSWMTKVIPEITLEEKISKGYLLLSLDRRRYLRDRP